MTSASVLWTVATTTDGEGSFTAGPSALLILYTLLTTAVLCAGLMTAAKGRWGWLLLGLVTVGVVWLYSASLPASPGSLWQRAGSRRRARRLVS